jgi:hypothetical protein
MLNRTMPQSKQVTSFGNTQTPGLSTFARPLTWMTISEANSFSLVERHNKQGMSPSQVLWFVLGHTSTYPCADCKQAKSFWLFNIAHPGELGAIRPDVNLSVSFRNLEREEQAPESNQAPALGM